MIETSPCRYAFFGNYLPSFCEFDFQNLANKERHRRAALDECEASAKLSVRGFDVMDRSFPPLSLKTSVDPKLSVIKRRFNEDRIFQRELER
jgi:hypothetical protein